MPITDNTRTTKKLKKKSHQQFDFWYEGVAHLVRPLASMAPHMIPHFAEFHTSVVAYRTLVGFLVSVFVPNVSYQFTCGR
jgi:hypothetical protein